ncbi:hypothetical protein ABVT39_020642 [Epinephelus coioides]
MRKTTGKEEALKDMMGRRRAEIDTGKEKETGSYRNSYPARDNMAQSESSLIGHRYLEKCKVGLDSAGYLQTERYYTLLIGSARALLINQIENRHQEQRKRQEEEEEEESDGWRRTSEEENEVSSSRVISLPCFL